MAIYYDSDNNKRYGSKSLLKAKLSLNNPNVHILNAVSPSYDALTQQVSDSGTVEQKDDGSYHIVWTIEDRDLDEAKKDMKLTLAEIRYNKEISGAETTDGVKILTDRQNQSITNSVYSSLVNNIISSTKWKSPTGWIEVTAAELLPIVTALNEHISKSFEAEHTVSVAIDNAESCDDLRAINLQADFDSAYLA